MTTTTETAVNALHGVISNAYATGFSVGCKITAKEMNESAKLVASEEVKRAVATQRAEFLALIEAAQRKHHPASEAHKLCRRLIAVVVESKP